MKIRNFILDSPDDGYELIDMGNGRKLERFGDYLIDRPAPQASGKRQLADWQADWVYSGSRVTEGEWQAQREGLPRDWSVNMVGQQLHCRLGKGGQLGIYPEHAACWQWLRERLEGCYHIDELRVLNLFAGTGAATQAAVMAGAQVTHVDAQASQLELARLNVGDKGARFIKENVMTYVERLLRKGERYHMVIMDPPSFGRAGKGKVWDIRCDLQPLIKYLPRLVTQDCRGIWVSIHTRDMRAEGVADLINQVQPGTAQPLQLGTQTKDGRVLHAGVAAIWQDDSELSLEDTAATPLTAMQIEERLDVLLETEFSARGDATAAALELADFSREQQAFALRWVEIIASTNLEMAYQFARRAATALKSMEEKMIEAWLLNTMDLYDTTGLHAGLGAMRDVEKFIEQAEDKARGVSFNDVAGMLEIFVQGLNGRSLKLECGEEVCTDTETLYLPLLVTRFPDRDANFRLYKATVVHLWAQGWYGTFQGNVLNSLAAYEDTALAQRLFHRLETIRLDACLQRDLPGVHRDMRELCEAHAQQLVPAGWQDYAVRLAEPTASASDSLEYLAQLYPGEPPPRLSYQGVLRPVRVQAVMALRLQREKQQFRIMLARLADERAQHREPQPDEEPASQTESTRFELQVNSDEQGNAVNFDLLLDGDAVAPPEGVQAMMESIIQDIGKIPDDYLVAAGEGSYRMLTSTEQADEPVTQTVTPDDHTWYYKEWDFKRRHYRKNWCVLRERKVTPADSTFVKDTLHKYMGQVKDIRRTFEALRGEDKLLKRQPNGENVDIDALVEAWADARAGRELSDDLFTKMHKQERSIAVMFMVDMSGSTKGWINDAERESLVLLCEALEILGDRYAIYGFSGWTRTRCDLYPVKGFDELYSEEVQARIAGIAPKDYTRMGVIIRHLSTLLNDVDARTRLLITLSDGKPDDFDGYRGEYGIEDTRMALLEARRMGIHPFCITIDKQAHDYLPHMYGAVNYTVIDDVKKLPLKVADIYRRLTS